MENKKCFICEKDIKDKEMYKMDFDIEKDEKWIIEEHSVCKKCFLGSI